MTNYVSKIRGGRVKRRILKRQREDRLGQATTRKGLLSTILIATHFDNIKIEVIEQITCVNVQRNLLVNEQHLKVDIQLRSAIYT